MQGWVSKTGGAPKAFLPVLLRRVRWVGLDSSRRAAMVPGPWTGDSSHTLARLPSMLGGRHSAGSRESVLNLRLVRDQMQPSAPGPGKPGPTG